MVTIYMHSAALLDSLTASCHYTRPFRGKSLALCLPVCTEQWEFVMTIVRYCSFVAQPWILAFIPQVVILQLDCTYLIMLKHQVNSPPQEMTYRISPNKCTCPHKRTPITYWWNILKIGENWSKVTKSSWKTSILSPWTPCTHQGVCQCAGSVYLAKYRIVKWQARYNSMLDIC